MGMVGLEGEYFFKKGLLVINSPSCYGCLLTSFFRKIEHGTLEERLAVEPVVFHDNL